MLTAKDVLGILAAVAEGAEVVVLISSLEESGAASEMSCGVFNDSAKLRWGDVLDGEV